MAIVTLTSMNLAAQSPKSTCDPIPFDQLVEMLATDAHWDQDNLTAIGLNEIFSDSFLDEECGEFSFFVYGKNVKVNAAEDWNLTLESNGCHAFAIEVTLMTDNGTRLYFKEKADHDAFMASVRESSHYSRNEYNEYIGLSLIESDEYVDDWYVISVHGG